MLTIHVDYHSEVEAYVSRLNDTVRAGAEEGAALVADIARRTVAVDTGSLQDTIDAEETMAGETHIEWSVNAGNTSGGFKGGGLIDKPAGSPVNYAEAQEYGGGGPGKYTPFMTPASEQGWVEYQQLMADLISSISV